MTNRATIKLDKEAYDFLKEVGGSNRSACCITFE